MKKVFDINVVIEGFSCVKTQDECINMISFGGDCHCDFFDGVILPGGVDTQKFLKNEDGTLKPGTLSARYILEGKDKQGNPAKIFIENNGVVDKDGNVTTNPVVFTDNEGIKSVLSQKFIGKVKDLNAPEHNKILIEFYVE